MEMLDVFHIFGNIENCSLIPQIKSHHHHQYNVK